MTWHLSWPLVQHSKAQRMDLFSLLFSKEWERRRWGKYDYFPENITERSDEEGWFPKKMAIHPVWHCRENRTVSFT